MLSIGWSPEGQIVLEGRFDAAQADKATAFFDRVKEPAVVDLGRLTYISSLGLAVLLKTQKRLRETAGQGLRLVNVTPHIHDVFRYSGFDQIFEIESRPA